jgi:hypothetical protein
LQVKDQKPIHLSSLLELGMKVHLPTRFTILQINAAEISLYSYAQK